MYTGSTNDIEKRLKQHNMTKQGAKYTRMRRPVILSYTETFATLHEARVRENEIKRMRRAEKKVLIKSTVNNSLS